MEKEKNENQNDEVVIRKKISKNILVASQTVVGKSRTYILNSKGKKKKNCIGNTWFVVIFGINTTSDICYT